MLPETNILFILASQSSTSSPALHVYEQLLWLFSQHQESTSKHLAKWVGHSMFQDCNSATPHWHCTCRSGTKYYFRTLKKTAQTAHSSLINRPFCHYIISHAFHFFFMDFQTMYQLQCHFFNTCPAKYVSNLVCFLLILLGKLFMIWNMHYVFRFHIKYSNT